jgi:hypothetical protein
MANFSFFERLLSFLSSRWTPQGYDTFSREDYDLPGHCWTEVGAQWAARRRLRYLQRTQPSASSGGQNELGIKDRVFIVRPNKTNYRYLPDNWRIEYLTEIKLRHPNGDREGETRSTKATIRQRYAASASGETRISVNAYALDRMW